jgi:hypothetical protein
VIREDLFDENAGIAVIDSNRDFHFLEREDGSVGLLLIARYQNAGVGSEQTRQQRQRRSQNEN